METEVEIYFCPICQNILPGKPRYENSVCLDCRKKTTSADGRLVEFFTYTGGRFADTGEPYKSEECFINGIKCRGFENRFGSIIIERCLTLEEKIRGGIVGLLVGDALGVPYEFHAKEEIPAFEKIEFAPPMNFQRAHAGVPVGTWSDDGAQALCLLASLLKCSKLDTNNFAEKLVAWFRDGYMAVDEMFDVGIQTQRAILNLRKGIAPLEAGPTDENSNGNGSLMRVLPLALWHRGTKEELVKDAMLQSKITHGHLRSQLCCALYCLWTQNVLHEVRQSFQKASSDLRKIFENDSDALREIEIIENFDWNNLNGSGYVVDSLLSAVDCCHEASYEAIVKAAIALGNDTDTTACIAGGIAGIKFGINGIPKRWRENLRGKDIYEPLLKKLIEMF